MVDDECGDVPEVNENGFGQKKTTTSCQVILETKVAAVRATFISDSA